MGGAARRRRTIGVRSVPTPQLRSGRWAVRSDTINSFQLVYEVGDTRISTADLHGVEHSGGTFFETMVFVDGDELWTWRHKTAREAQEFHRSLVLLMHQRV